MSFQKRPPLLSHIYSERGIAHAAARAGNFWQALGHEPAVNDRSLAAHHGVSEAISQGQLTGIPKQRAVCISRFSAQPVFAPCVQFWADRGVEDEGLVRLRISR